tara:strand:+ start:72 stop:386 length:315 start_codon:yes stop_codon:yes gene_type:complete
MSKKEKFESIMDRTLIKEVRVSKSVTSSNTGAVHKVDLVADVDNLSMSEAVIVVHALGMKAEAAAFNHLSILDEISDEDVQGAIATLRSSYGRLINLEMENMKE